MLIRICRAQYFDCYVNKIYICPHIVNGILKKYVCPIFDCMLIRICLSQYCDCYVNNNNLSACIR